MLGFFAVRCLILSKEWLQIDFLGPGTERVVKGLPLLFEWLLLAKNDAALNLSETSHRIDETKFLVRKGLFVESQAPTVVPL